jgi:KRAB domain-containing zinc finger protein
MGISTVCFSCGKQFSTRAKARVHELHNCKQNVNCREKEACLTCGAMILRTDMQRHINNVHHHADRMQCDYCGRVLTREGMVYHMTNHVGQNLVKCTHCDKKMSYKSIANHVKTQHSATKPPPKELKTCKVCGKEVAFLRSHMKTHAEKEECTVCGKMFSKHTLPVHMKRHTKQLMSAVDLIPCEKCGKACTKEIMRSHLRTHEPRINCTVCGKEYSVDGMRKHMRKAHSK